MTHESPVYPTRLTTRPRHSLVPAALALAALALSLHAQAQTPEWVWMGGSSTSPHFLGCNPGAYGNMGSPAPDNIPGGRTPAATWVDKGGNFWLFGGNGCNSAGVVNNLNDLWEFSPTTLEWTWQGVTTTGPADRSSTATWTDSSGNLWLFGGVDPTSSTNLNDLWEFSPSTLDWTLIGMSGSTGVYGNLGTPNAANFPGARSGAANWTDTSGNLWLFGGNGVDSAGTKGNLNDLWEFSPSTLEWTWVGGSSTVGQPGVYGTPGTPSATNIPGARQQAVSWTDSSGNFWLFGSSNLNDLWEFDPSAKKWTWMAGSNSAQDPAYGMLGSPAASNIPGVRTGELGWADVGGNLWLFGGFGTTADHSNEGGFTQGYLNDLWEFTPTNMEWTWMGGDSNPPEYTYYPAAPGVYGSLGVPAATNVPGSRTQAASWTDSNGNFWLFGGLGYDSVPADNRSDLNDLWAYGITPAPPTFSLPAGTYSGTQPVTISDATSGATIYYTTDGTTPSPSSTQYSGSITLDESSETLKAFAGGKGFLSGTVTSASYVLTGLPPVATPVFSPAGGTFKSAQHVTITDATPNAVIYYAIGSTPTTTSTVYAGPITVSSSETVEAIAIAPGHSTSVEASASYTIATTTTTLDALVSPPDTFNLNCTVTAAGLAGKPALTGTLTLSDITSGKTLSTGPVTAGRSQPIDQQLSSLVGNVPVALATGDFNGDGNPDMAF